jgi:hypothetical protein
MGMSIAAMPLDKGISPGGQPHRTKRHRRPEPVLKVLRSFITDVALRGLIDASIVPSLVVKFLSEKGLLENDGETEHTECPL